MSDIEKPQYSKEDLSEMELPDLYDILAEQVDSMYSSEKERSKENMQVKGNLIKLVFRALFKTLLVSKNNDSKMEKRFLDLERWYLDKINLEPTIEIDEKLQEKVDSGDLENKGLIVYTNHHGGGLETFCSREILAHIKNSPVRWVLKDGLTKIPVYGGIIKKSKPIIIERRKPEDTDAIMKKKLKKYGEQIAQTLLKNETVVVAFEGTRSRDGDITEIDKFKKVASTLEFFTKVEIKKGGDKYKDLEYNKVLMTVDTVTALPKAPEKDFRARTGMKGGVSAYLELLPDDVSLKAPEYPKPILQLPTEKKIKKAPYKNGEHKNVQNLNQRLEEYNKKVDEIRKKTDNIFGYTRAKLKKILIARILENQEK